MLFSLPDYFLDSPLFNFLPPQQKTGDIVHAE